ncbi:hypothetical protein Pcinc_034030 [Petrolisthes cinctipes]|uniref:Uncharacterized protein n=1 Tax=Petrolisthes cinctipes TaxID=88211 RepID=A0AAE1K0Q0_PETCI|nr:hypothetical protein Pcinc_034030 [Petrolisthes cinctipes]
MVILFNVEEPRDLSRKPDHNRDHDCMTNTDGTNLYYTKCLQHLVGPVLLLGIFVCSLVAALITTNNIRCFVGSDSILVTMWAW